MSNSKEIIICQICEREFKHLGTHLKHKHQLTYKEYYDTYLKKEGEGICLTCGEETKIYRGNYRKYCSNVCGLTNPDAIKIRIEVCKQTLADNPEINTKRAEKTRQTLVDNPEIEQRRKNNNLSIAHRNYYKSISNPDSLEIHCLYIMENLTKPIIKIGFCSEKTMEKRSSDICRDFGKSEPILILKASHKSVNRIETYLHKYFNEHCKVQPKGYGRTEWFDKKIKEEAKLIASSKIEQFT